MTWIKYTELERLKRLPNEGRELLGKHIYITEKRDGENVSVWLDENDQVKISSHNLEVASEDIVNRLVLTPEMPRIVALLIDEKHTWHNDCIVYGELLKTVSPTRIEPRRKHIHWIIFDIYSKTLGKYMDYTLVYQKAFGFKIPVVKLLDDYIALTMDELDSKIEQHKKWCRIHRREGIVGKCFDESIFFKEKINLPKKSKLERPQTGDVQYPPMPEEKIIRALQHAYDEIGETNWTNKGIAMPIVARHIATEAREHNYAPPKNFFNYYINTPMEVIKTRIIEFVNPLELAKKQYPDRVIPPFPYGATGDMIAQLTPCIKCNELFWNMEFGRKLCGKCWGA